MRARLLLAACLAAVPVVGSAQSWALDASEWARPRSAEVVASMDPVVEAVRAWSARPGARLVIEYAGGEQGALWAAELRDWLVALGVPGAAIETVAGGPPRSLTLRVMGDEET